MLFLWCINQTLLADQRHDLRSPVRAPVTLLRQASPGCLWQRSLQWLGVGVGGPLRRWLFTLQTQFSGVENEADFSVEMFPDYFYI